MKNKMIVWSAGSVLALAFLACPISINAAETVTNVSGTNQPPPKPKRIEVSPYHGKISAIDLKTKTLSVATSGGDLVLEVSSKTHIIKDGQPATLDQGVVGGAVSGAYRKSPDGKLHAVSIHMGAHPIKPRKEMGAGTTNGPSSLVK